MVVRGANSVSKANVNTIRSENDDVIVEDAETILEKEVDVDMDRILEECFLVGEEAQFRAMQRSYTIMTPYGMRRYRQQEPEPQSGY